MSPLDKFSIKLFKLPMSFFDTKLMGDLLQRIGDHTRVQNFLTGQMLSIVFTLFSFVIFGFVLLIYNSLIFIIFFCRKFALCFLAYIVSKEKKNS